MISYFSKKLLAIFLAVFAFAASNTWAALGSPNASGYYEIRTCTELQEFADLVNGGTTNANAILMNSFDCAVENVTSYTPIGNDSRKYTGTFNGNGFTIKNLNCGGTQYAISSSENKQYVGLLGYTASGAEIKNVFLEDQILYSKSNSSGDDRAGYAGGIVGRNEGGNIHDCVVKNAIIYGAKGGEGKRSYSGGIVGYNVSGDIYNCSVIGNTYIESTQAVGGIAGYKKAGNIHDCLSFADVVSVANTSGGYAGGIVGADSASVGTLSRCVYSGNLVKPGSSADAAGGAIAGGPYAKNSKATHNCDTLCYYTYEGLAVGINDNLDTDEERIKHTLGQPWDTMEGDLILRPSSGSEMYYEVTFTPNGHGVAPFTKTVQKDTYLPKPPMIVSNGFAIDAWCKTASCDGEMWNFETDKVLEEGIILYGKWKIVHEVIFDANGGTYPENAVTSKFFATGEAITVDGVTEPDNRANSKKFKGWALTNDATEPAASFGTMGSESITLYAVWEVVPTYTITYNKGTICGGSPCNGIDGVESTSDIKVDGVDIQLKGELFTNARRNSSHYIQTGWATIDGGDKVYEFGGTYTENNNITLYPSWQNANIKITYKPGEGTGTEQTRYKTSGLNINLLGNIFTRDGYVQDGWAKSQGGSRAYSAGGTYRKDSVLTLYPYWVPVYTVTFDTDGGTPSIDEQTLGDYAKVTEPAAPTKTGFDFMGWYSGEGFTHRWDFENDRVTSSITLKAKWESTTYTITFAAGAGEGISGSHAALTRTKGGPAVTLPNKVFTKSGFVQDGWTSIDGSAKEFELGANYAVNASITLYPHWAEIPTFALTIKGLNNVDIDTKYYPAGETVTLTPPAVDYYTFTGWTNNAELTITDNSFTMPANAVTVTANYTVNKYPLTWELNGGTINNEIDYTAAGQIDYGAAITAPSLTKENYTFTGWAPELSATMPGEAVTYTAQWTVNTKTITVLPGNGNSYPVTVTVLDNFNEIVNKINTELAGLDITPKPTNPDDKYNYNHTGWEFEDPNYIPTFDSTAKTIQVHVLYNDGTNDQDIAVDVLATDSDDGILGKINEALKDVTPIKPATLTHTYVFDSWEKKGDGSYGPVFNEVVITFDIIVVYGDNPEDEIKVTIEATDDDNAIQQKILKKFKDESIPLPTKNPNKYNVYEFDKFVKDEGTGVYKPSFTPMKVNEDIIVKYVDKDGEQETTVIAPIEASEEDVIAIIKEALKDVTPIIPDDPTYRYDFADTWEKKPDGSYSPVFTPVEKTKNITVVYGEGADESIIIPVGVTLDTDNEIIKKINKVLDDESIEVKKASTDKYDYQFNEWVKEGEDTFVATFKSIPIKGVIVVKYGEGENDTIHVIIELDDSDNEIIDSITKTFNNHFPELNKPTKESDEIYDYEFDGWEKKEDGSFGPKFNETVKSKDITVVYNDQDDNITVSVLVTDDDETIVTKIETALENNFPPIVPSKQETTDSTFTYVTFEKDENSDSYIATFKGEVKKETIIVKYGDGEEDTIHVVIHVPDTDEQIQDKINDSLAYHEKPMPTKAEDNDSTYAFDKFEKNAGNDMYEPTFIGTVKTKEITAVYNDKGDTIIVTVHVPDAISEIVEKIEAELGNRGPTFTPSKQETTDSTFTYVTFEKDENSDSYIATFKGEVKKETIIVKYGDGEEDTIHVVIHVPDTDEKIQEKINDSLAYHEKPMPTKAEDNDSTYAFDKFEKNAEKDMYEPTFIGTVKTKEITAVYNDKGDTIIVTVHVPDAISEIVEKIEAELGNRGPTFTPSKQETTDSTFTYVTFEKDENSDSYIATFKGEVKKETIIVKYGEGEEDTIHVVIHVPDTDEKIQEKIENALANHEPQIPMPTKAEDNDSTYAFDKFEKDAENGVYEPTFNGTPKTKQIKVVYGEGNEDFILISVKVQDTEKQIINEIEYTYAKQGLPKPSKASNETYDYEFSGWKKKSDDVYIAGFAAIISKKTITVLYGDNENDRFNTSINVTDTESEISDKIDYEIAKRNIKKPTKKETKTEEFKFIGWKANSKTGYYEPQFETIVKIITFKITYNMPKTGKLSENVNTYNFGVVTKLPLANIENDSSWEFKGWYTKPDGFGTRYKNLNIDDFGDKTFYALFQKGIRYEVNGELADVVIIYSDDPQKSIKRALESVIPEDFEKKGKTYTFNSWKYEKGIYKAQFAEATSLKSSKVPHFNIAVNGRGIEITGAKANSHITIFDMSGRIVTNKIMVKGTEFIKLSKAGCYIVRMNNQTTQVNIK